VLFLLLSWKGKQFTVDEISTSIDDQASQERKKEGTDASLAVKMFQVRLRREKREGGRGRSRKLYPS